MTRSPQKIVAYILAGSIVFVLTSAVTAQALLLPRAKGELEKDLRALYDPKEMTVVIDSKVFLIDVANAGIRQLTVDLGGVDSARAASAADRFISPIEFSEVRFDLHGVHFDRRKILGGISAFEAERGSLEVRIEEGEFNKYLQSEGYGLTVTVSGAELSSTADVVGDGNRTFQISARARLEITETSLAVIPEVIDQRGVESKSARLALEALVPIPPVAGFRATSVGLEDHQIVLRAPVTKLYAESLQETAPVEGAGAGETETIEPQIVAPSPPRPTPTSTTPTRSPSPTRKSPTPTSTRRPA